MPAATSDSVDDPGGHTSYVRDLSGRPVNVSLPNGIHVTREYDSVGRVTRVSYTSRFGVILLELVYTRDMSGRVIRVQESTGRDCLLRYDVLGRLVQQRTVDSGSAPETISYEYDDNGNVTRRSDNTRVQTYSYDSNDRLLGDSMFTYAWDANGNLVSRQGLDFQETLNYDSQNRLVRFVRTGAGAAVIDYGYDVDGLLASRTIDGHMTRFVWDRGGSGLPQLLEERTSTGAVNRRYGRGDLGVTHFRDVSGAVSVLLTDYLGSVRAIARDDGSVE